MEKLCTWKKIIVKDFSWLATSEIIINVEWQTRDQSKRKVSKGV